jgi:hypothetical protein
MVYGGQKMSVLRDIVFFMLIFQLSLEVTNLVQIQAPSAGLPDGLYLSTGEITPFQTWFNPLNDLIVNLNSTNTALQSMNQFTTPTNSTIRFTIPRLFWITTPFAWDVYVHPDSSAVIPLIGIPLQWFDLGLLTVSILFVVIFTVFGAAWSFVAVLIVLLLNVTLGAIPFYISLFSLIDPVLGFTLGTCLGGLQMVVVGWELIAVIPQIQLKGKDE